MRGHCGCRQGSECESAPCDSPAVSASLSLSVPGHAAHAMPIYSFAVCSSVCCRDAERAVCQCARGGDGNCKWFITCRAKKLSSVSFGIESAGRCALRAVRLCVYVCVCAVMLSFSTLYVFLVACFGPHTCGHVQAVAWLMHS